MTLGPGNPPDPDWQAWVNSVKCGPDPPWSDMVIYRLPSGSDNIKCGRIPLGFPKPQCDASRTDWQSIQQEWNERKRVYIWLCKEHAVAGTIAKVTRRATSPISATK